ncbi:MAG: formylglycine-generating enzyme family protein [Chthoniobacterales bacterium]
MIADLPTLTTKLVELPAGDFLMGATDDDRFASILELPRRRVSVPAFQLAATPLTFSEWDAYAAATDSYHPPDYGTGRGDHPVTNVSWNDAQAFLAWLRAETGAPYRLPTEAEWEYACRAGTTTIFHTGDDLALDSANFWYSEEGKKIGPGHPTPVASYPPNAFGLHDLHGTVCELVADTWHNGYHDLPTNGTAHDAPAESCIVIRGGAWDLAPRLLRSAYRDWLPRDLRLDNVGFRLALTPPISSS